MQQEDGNYISHYQKFLDAKEKITLHDLANERTQTKLAPRLRKKTVDSCKLCKLFAKREDAARILNQGLYNKYTSSIDYYYTKDINAIIMRKRKPFCIKYCDELMFDEEKEYLKKYFSIRESYIHMDDIKNFYTKFKDFPKFFELPFFQIIGSMIRKHRRIEYYRVFKGKNNEERSIADLAHDDRFEIMDMLGESFKQNLYRNEQKALNSRRSNTERTGRDEHSLVDIQKNFNELWSNKPSRKFIDLDDPYSSEYYQFYTSAQNIYPLYSRHDSENALRDLVELVDDFKKDVHPRPKLNYNPPTNFHQLGGPAHIGTPKYTTARPSSQMASHSQNSQSKPFFSNSSRTVETEGAATPVGLAKNVFPPSTANFQRQRPVNQPGYRSHSEKTSSSPQMRSGNKYNRNTSSDKVESSYANDDELQKRIAIMNHMQNVGLQESKSVRKRTELYVNPNLNASKRKLLIDVQDMNIDRTNLCKSITDKFKSSTNLNLGSRIHMPGKDFTPYMEAAVRSNSNRTAKGAATSGKRYILSKRSEAAMKPHYLPEYNSAFTQQHNDENFNVTTLTNFNSSSTQAGSARKKTYRKSNSYGTMDKILPSYPTTSKEGSANKQLLDEVDTNQPQSATPHQGRSSYRYSSTEKTTPASRATPLSYYEASTPNSTKGTPTKIFKKMGSAEDQYYSTIAGKVQKTEIRSSRINRQDLYPKKANTSPMKLIDQMIRMVNTPSLNDITNAEKTPNASTRNLRIPPSIQRMVEMQQQQQLGTVSEITSNVTITSPGTRFQHQIKPFTSSRRNKSTESQGATPQPMQKSESRGHTRMLSSDLASSRRYIKHI